MNATDLLNETTPATQAILDDLYNNVLDALLDDTAADDDAPEFDLVDLVEDIAKGHIITEELPH